MGQKLAILIPYRDRAEHLKEFIKSALPYIKSQNPDSDLYVIEQEEGKRFNRGMLFNCGYDLIKNKGYDYICLHDVDLMPENSDYSFSNHPTHLSKYCSQFNYELTYEPLFGGVVIITPEIFEKVNGFANNFWGWGVEDDDLRDRITNANIEWKRREGRYKSLEHEKNECDSSGKVYQHVKTNRDLYFANKRKKNYESGLSDLKYNVLKTEELNNYIKYTLNI